MQAGEMSSVCDPTRFAAAVLSSAFERSQEDLILEGVVVPAAVYEECRGAIDATPDAGIETFAKRAVA
jgi:hypothetical protein